MRRKSGDYETIVRAFRSTSYPYATKWKPDVLGVYGVTPNTKYQSRSVLPDQIYSQSVAADHPNPALLYHGMQLHSVGDFLRGGFSEGRSKVRMGRVYLQNTSFGACNYHCPPSPPFTCGCVAWENDVIYVVVCQVPAIDGCLAYPYGRKPLSMGLHEFEKYAGRYSLHDNCHYRDSRNRGLSGGVFPRKLEGPIKALDVWDNFLVDARLVKPVYLVAARFHFER